jgi:putative inorganic carbon (HCO3(-)) transporter
MTDGLVAPTHSARANGTLAVAATISTLVLAVAVAHSGRPAAIAFLASVGIVGVLAAIASPRWVLAAAVVALIAYLPDAIGGSAGSHATAALPALVAVGVIARHTGRVERVRMPPSAKWFVVLGVALLVAMIGARDRSLAMGEISDFVGFAVLATVLVALVDTASWLRRMEWGVVAALAFLAALTDLQQVTRTFGRTFSGLAVATPDRGVLRSGGPLSPNFFGEALVAGAVLAVYLALAARSRRERSTAVAAAAVMLVAVVYTQSRGAFVAVAVAALVVARLRRVPLPTLVATATALVVFGILVLPVEVKDRIGELGGLASSRISATSDSSLRGRASENLAALEMFRAHPLLGVGPNNFELAYPGYAQHLGLDQRPELRAAHSLYLESLAETGVIGSVAFFGLLGAAVRCALRARRMASDRTRVLLAEGALVALVTFLVAAATLHLAYPRYLWTFVALAFASQAVTS